MSSSWVVCVHRGTRRAADSAEHQTIDLAQCRGAGAAKIPHHPDRRNNPDTPQAEWSIRELRRARCSASPSPRLPRLTAHPHPPLPRRPRLRPPPLRCGAWEASISAAISTATTAITPTAPATPPTVRSTTLYNFNDKTDQFNLAGADLAINHSPDPIGVHADIVFGRTNALIHAASEKDTDNYLEQAYISSAPAKDSRHRIRLWPVRHIGRSRSHSRNE